MNSKFFTLLIFTLFHSISTVSGQADLSLCVTMPNGEIITGIDNIGTFIDDCYEMETQSDSVFFCPTKNNSLLNGVDVLDAVYLQHIILSGNPISPYEMAALDINNSGLYEEIELVFFHFLIVGKLLTFPNAPSWKFAPESTIPTSSNNLVLPDCIEIENLPQSDTSIAVIGIKTGDLNFSAQPDIVYDTTEMIPNPLIFKTINLDFYAGDTIEVFFTSDNYNQIIGYQNTIKFDPDVLKVVSHTDTEIDQMFNYFGDIDNVNGILNTFGRTWQGLYQFNDASPFEPIYSVTFEAQTDGILVDALDFTSDSTPKAAYDSSQVKRNVILQFEGDVFNDISEKEEAETQLQITPNPITDQLNISIDMPNSGQVQMRLFDTKGGSEIILINEWMEAGAHQITITDTSRFANGFNYLTCTIDKKIITKKLFIIN